ncbi:mediator of RNA polymerase II transcription subunit 33A-like [Rutidosis leptorrhynchoides]|uniref:mediator of RNA polymerase II transcription subunit 33A-like n=1 Tax=Rutidosis leptorrhynchoides TaxID=125765 RepID=UPI003A9957E7
MVQCIAKSYMEAINNTLQLSQRFGISSSEPGLILVEFVLAIVWQLLDASLDDEDLLELVPEKQSIWSIKPNEMETDDHNIRENKIDCNDRLFRTNTLLAIEIIGELNQNKVTSKILCLARQNMPIHWGSFIYNLKLLAANSMSLRNSKDITLEAVLQLTSDNYVPLSRECKTISLQQFHAVIASVSHVPSAVSSYGASWSAFWLPIDLFLEDTMEGTVVATTSSAESLTGELHSVSISISISISILLF